MRERSRSRGGGWRPLRCRGTRRAAWAANLLDLTSGYGYRPWLALIWMVLFAGFGYGVFTHGKGSFSIAAEVKALSLCHAYSFPRKLCVRLMSLHGARASLRGRRGAAS